MRFPDAVKEHQVDEPELRSEDDTTVIRPARTVTKQAQYVLIVELTRNLATYYVRTDNVEQYIQALKAATDTEDQGAQIGSWCIKYMDGTPKYGMLASEDTPDAKHVAHLHQKQLDRIKALGTIVFRDKTTGNLLDAAGVAVI